ncbi:hypothetical protein DV737_g4839, partial [Chaetothyriales sp. CBS 132003]
MVERIPHGQLNSFSFLHRTPLSFSTLESISTAHCSSLRKLCVFEIETTDPGTAHLPVNLQTLECRVIGNGKAIGKLINANKRTLRRLLLGQEKEMVEKYAQTRHGFLDTISQPSSPLLCAEDLQDIPQLQELDLCGIDLRPLVPTTADQGLEFYKLTRLSLESCPGTEIFLRTLADAYFISQNASDSSESRTAPRLQHFLFRSETPTAALKEALTRFLASFKGLRTLSLLFENASLLDGASSLIAEHGLTLNTLILESRIQPRESLALDTSRPFGMDGFSEELWDRLICDVCRLCPNLIELGTGFPWNEETVRLRKSPLPTLKHLKTVHVRNFPESQVLSQLGDYSIKEYAAKFVEWVYPASRGGTQPRLETIAIGPTLYESRWKSNGRRQQPPEYLRTHYFCVDFGQTRFGRWSPMITPISQKYMEEIRDEKHLSGPEDLKVIELSSDSPRITGPSGVAEAVAGEFTRKINQAQEILSARFNDEHHDPPITFANDINNRHLSGKFQFVNEYIIHPGVKIIDHRLDIGCSCLGISLSETFLANELDPAATKFEITECNENCGCSFTTCWNRVVHGGRTVPLEIFETATCGFGVRSSSPIIRGQFIDLYLGEVITQEELERREDAKEEGASSYVFSLDFFKSSPGQECYHVDGEYFGTAMRFVNHSCSPNARSFTVVRGQNTDKRVHHVAFFAIRDIIPGEEICIDYRNDSQVGVDDADADSEEDVQSGLQQQSVTDLVDPRNLDRGERDGDNDDGLVRCQCGAANCRKWLWPPIVRKRKRKQRQTLDNNGP